MATNFNKNVLIANGGLKISTIDTPADVRTRIETISDVTEIPLPYVGMLFYVKDEDKYYKVKSLGSKIVSGKEIANMIIDQFEEFVSGSSQGF